MTLAVPPVSPDPSSPSDVSSPFWAGYQPNIQQFESSNGAQAGNGGGALQFDPSNVAAFSKQYPQFASLGTDSPAFQKAAYNWLGTQNTQALANSGVDPQTPGAFYGAWALGPKAAAALAKADPTADAATVVKNVSPTSYNGNKSLFAGGPTAGDLLGRLDSVQRTGTLAGASDASPSPSGAPAPPAGPTDPSPVASASSLVPTPSPLQGTLNGGTSSNKLLSFASGMLSGHSFGDGLGKGLGNVQNNNDQTTTLGNSAIQGNFGNALDRANALITIQKMSRQAPIPGTQYLDPTSGQWMIKTSDQFGNYGNMPLGGDPKSIVSTGITQGGADGRQTQRLGTQVALQGQRLGYGANVKNAGVGPTGAVNQVAVPPLGPMPGPAPGAPPGPPTVGASQQVAPAPGQPPGIPPAAQAVIAAARARQMAQGGAPGASPPGTPPQGGSPPGASPQGAPMLAVNPVSGQPSLGNPLPVQPGTAPPAAAVQAGGAGGPLQAGFQQGQTQDAQRATQPPVDPISAAASNYVQQLTANVPKNIDPTIGRAAAKVNGQAFDSIQQSTQGATDTKMAAAKALDVVTANPSAFPGDALDRINNAMIPVLGFSPFSGLTNGQLQVSQTVQKMAQTGQLASILHDALHISRITQGEVTNFTGATANGSMAASALAPILNLVMNNANSTIAEGQIIGKAWNSGQFPVAVPGSVASLQSQVQNDLETGKYPDIYKPATTMGPVNAPASGSLPGASPVPNPGQNSVATPTTQAQFDALPSGAQFVNPANGEVMTKK